MLKGDVSPTQLKSLSDWHEITSDEGIDMPTKKIFYKKVLLAVSLWPQKDIEGINYLLGKGIGVEIALRGNVRGRSRQTTDFLYRSHSDFELYGVSEDNEEIYPKEFKQIFGAQDRYPKTNRQSKTTLLFRSICN